MSSFFPLKNYHYYFCFFKVLSAAVVTGTLRVNLCASHMHKSTRSLVANVFFFSKWQQKNSILTSLIGGKKKNLFRIEAVKSLTSLLFGPCQVKKCLQACTKYHPGLCSSLIHSQSVVSHDSVKWQWMPWSDCTDPQADLGFHCPHMPKDTFLHDAAHVILHRDVSQG